MGTDLVRGKPLDEYIDDLEEAHHALLLLLGEDGRLIHLVDGAHLRAGRSTAINGNQWQSMAINGNQWQSMASHGNPRHSMAINGTPWQSMALNGTQLHSMANL